MPRVSPIRLRPSIAAPARPQLIEGHLRELVGTERAQRLAVNGNPLLSIPTAPGASSALCVRPRSNGVQVGSADGKILKRVQFYEANRSQLPPRVRVVLGWDDPKAELTCISSPRWPARLRIRA